MVDWPSFQPTPPHFPVQESALDDYQTRHTQPRFVHDRRETFQYAIDVPIPVNIDELHHSRDDIARRIPLPKFQILQHPWLLISTRRKNDHSALEETQQHRPFVDDVPWSRPLQLHWQVPWSHLQTFGRSYLTSKSSTGKIIVMWTLGKYDICPEK